MNYVFVVYGLFIFFIFNLLTQKYCTKLEMNETKQAVVFRFTNMMILVLLISSYVKVFNSIGWN